MNVSKNGITVIVPDDEIIRMALARLKGEEALSLDIKLISGAAPRIGTELPGGVYAGIARGRDGAADYHLIVGPEHENKLGWEAACKWAEGLRLFGFADFSLPYRREQALCFANVPDLFKSDYYWSREQHADCSDYAWFQGFGYGYQDHWRKVNDLRARAVRRLPIQ